MNEAERNALMILLKDFRGYLADMTCDEYEIPDTPEGQELATTIAKLEGNTGGELTFYKGEITVGGTALADYLIQKLSA